MIEFKFAVSSKIEKIPVKVKPYKVVPKDAKYVKGKIIDYLDNGDVLIHVEEMQSNFIAKHIDFSPVGCKHFYTKDSKSHTGITHIINSEKNRIKFKTCYSHRIGEIVKGYVKENNNKFYKL